MHSLALNEEGILKKKEVDKIVDLRSKVGHDTFRTQISTIQNQFLVSDIDSNMIGNRLIPYSKGIDLIHSLS